MDLNDIGEIGDLNLPIITGGLEEDDGLQINISDVIEVIQTTDPTTAIGMFNQSATGSRPAMSNNVDPSQQHSPIGNNGQTAMQHQQQQQHTQQQQQAARNVRRKAYVKITEQPASKALRFRYECEGRSAGSIPGVTSTPENKTFPTIEIVGYKGRAVVVVSCVTKDPPYRPHPHNLVGKEGCKKGVCTVEINSETMRAVFSNLGIQCVKKKDIEHALRAREDIRVDPFKTGFSHRFQPSSIDLNSVRLCFQVFLESEQKGRFTVPLPPVVSDPIYDKKAMSDLVICTLCSCSSTVAGGREIILLCEKVAKEDISIRFFEEKDGQVLWEAFGDFQHTDVHKQTAIKFRTPRYKTLEIDQPVKIYIQLRRPSDGATSDALPFDYLPLDSDSAVLKRKRQKFGGDPSMHLFRHFQAQERRHQNQQNLQAQDSRAHQPMGFLNIPQNATIKSEPRDTSPLPYNVFGNTTNYRLPENSPSPQPLSPANIYHPSNTPSPYSVPAGNLISPNRHYDGGTNSPNINIEMTEFAYYQNQLTGQTIDNFSQIQPQNWNTDIKQQLPPGLSNLNTHNFNMDNLLITTTSTGQNHDSQQWNMNTSNMANKQLPLGNTLNFNVNQLLGSHGQHTQAGNMEGPNLSSLLDMDSEQLIQFNSAELQGLSLS